MNLDMGPAIEVNNKPDCAPGYAVTMAKFLLRNIARGIFRTNSADTFIGQFCRSAIHSSLDQFRLCVKAIAQLLISVVRIVSGSSKEKMVWVDASAIVAFMTSEKAIRYGSVFQFIRKAMRFDHSLLGIRKHAIATRECAGPNPATIGFMYKLPETLNLWTQTSRPNGASLRTKHAPAKRKAFALLRDECISAISAWNAKWRFTPADVRTNLRAVFPASNIDSGWFSFEWRGAVLADDNHSGIITQ